MHYWLWWNFHLRTFSILFAQTIATSMVQLNWKVAGSNLTECSNMFSDPTLLRGLRKPSVRTGKQKRSD